MKKYSCLALACAIILISGAARPGFVPAFEHITAILILDNSGSMETNDPDNLRFTGIHLFASLLDPGDSFGLIAFSTEAQILTDGLVIVDQPNGGADLIKNTKFPPADGFTDVKSALEEAAGLLDQTNLTDRKAVIVLLTDGKPELQNHYPAYEQETLDLARSLNIPVLSIALTSAGQTPFLNQLATDTSGAVIPARNASDLVGAYLNVLGQVKDRTVIGGDTFVANGTLEIEQPLSPYINSATFVVAKPEQSDVLLLGPDGVEITDDTSPDPRFALFTVESPAGGAYTTRSTGGVEMQVWGILRSRLRLRIVSPGTIHPAGEAINIAVNLLEETPQGTFTKIVGDAQFTATITLPDGQKISLDRFYDDGTHGDSTANDGNFTRTYPEAKQTGIYQIAVRGWKGAIPVQGEATTSVLKFPVITVLAPQDSVEIRGEPIELRVRLQSEYPLEAGRVFAVIVSPSGNATELEMRGAEFYTSKFLPLQDGRYEVRFELRDAVYQGMKYQTQAEYFFDVAVIPFASISLGEINTPAACLARADRVHLSLLVTSSDSGSLSFSAPDEWEIQPLSAQVKKGGQEIRLTAIAAGDLRDGTHRLKLLIGSADEIEVRPEATEIEFQIPNVWKRCVLPIRWGGFLLVMTMAGGIFVQRMRKAIRPVPVSGTLRHWRNEKHFTPGVEIDLTAIGKPTLWIGSGTSCDVMIPDAGLEAIHAKVLTEKTPDGVEALLEPVGEVRKGYSQQIAPFVLSHGAMFQMGEHEFQYLSDSGE